jgi:hypothetical protein
MVLLFLFYLFFCLEVKNVKAGDDGRVKGSSFLDVFRHSGKLLSHALKAGIKKKKKKGWIILFMVRFPGIVHSIPTDQ